jgi:hypothetical protein
MSTRPNGRKHYYHYDVVLDGEVIVSDAWEPCFETARALLERGITGSITFLDHNTLKPRITVKDAGKLTVVENSRSGPQLGKWKPVEGLQA